MICRLHQPRGFSLIEVMVSLAIITLILLTTTAMIDQTAQAWNMGKKGNSLTQDGWKILDAVMRNLSQATLNPYYDYYIDSDLDGFGDQRKLPSQTNFSPTHYELTSDLHFIMDASANLLPPEIQVNSTSHAVFFQAPSGYSQEKNYQNLSNALSVAGYYIEFMNDTGYLPDFFTRFVPDSKKRYRYRLMEVRQPTELFSVYESTKIPSKYPDPNPADIDWMQSLALEDSASPSKRILADNVIALILRPAFSLSDPTDPGKQLTYESYTYDSKGYEAAKPPLVMQNMRNNLPIAIDITLVVIDEASAVILQKQYQNRPYFNSDGLIDLNSQGGLFSSPASYDSDLADLREALTSKKINYYIFTSRVNLSSFKK